VLRKLVIAIVLLAAAGLAIAGVLLVIEDRTGSTDDRAKLRDQVATGGETRKRIATIASAGDIACPPGKEMTDDTCEQEATGDLLAGAELDAVLPLGDLQYEEGERSDFESSYDKSWGGVKDITRPVPGNHDYMTPGAEGYFDYFGEAAGEPGRGYYSYDIGRWHLIALNSNCDEVGGCDPGSEQERWLRDDLASHEARCTLAYWHHPRFSSGRHGNHDEFEPFWRSLYAAGADLVLSAHDHSYERFAPQTPAGKADRVRGIREFVVGTGGRNFYAFHSVEPNSEVQDNGTHGVLKLTLRPTTYEWEFVPEEGGSFTDSGSARCH
jgi:hypothetical protein